LDFFALTIGLTAMAFSWYSGGDDDEPKFKKGMKSLVYTAMLASISERFPQLGGAPFLLSVSDIINAVTVGTVLLDDAHFLLDASTDLMKLIQSGFTNEDAEDQETFGELVNGSFKGKKKW